MRKSLIMMVIMLTVFSLESVSAFFSQNSCGCFCGFRERTLELNVGYRRDYLHWKFEDPSIELIQTLIPFLVGKATEAETFLPSFSQTPARFITESDIPGVIGSVAQAIISDNDVYRQQWKNLRMINVGGTARAITCDDFYLRLTGNYAYACDGKYKPTGLYAGGTEAIDNVLSECGLAPSGRKRADGHTWDISGSIGYQMMFCDCDFRFIPQLGYAYHDIHLCSDTNCNRTFQETLSFFDNGSESVLLAGKSKANFDSYWTGPWLGFDAFYQLDCNLNLWLNFEYHWAYYRAHSKIKSHNELSFIEAENGIDGGASLQRQLIPLALGINSEFDHCTKFTHHACARGLFFGFGFNYNFCECWWGGFNFHWQDWKTFKHGRLRAKVISDLFLEEEIDEGGFEDEDADLSILNFHCKDTKLKTVHWNSYRIEVTISRGF